MRWDGVLEHQSAYEKIDQKYRDGNEVAVYEDVRFSAPGGRFLNERQIATVLEFMGDAPQRVLEVGCGTGRFTFELAAVGHDVTALDYSEAMLETCRAKKEQDPNGARVTLLEGSIFELPFEDDSFDRVLCVHVLMHLPEHEQGLAEIVRVLKPGGIAVFDIRNTWSINRVAYPLRRLAQRLQSREPWYVWYASVADVRRLAARLGAEVVRTRGLFPIKPNKMRGAMARFVEALEQAPDGAFSRRIGHIQMIALRKVQASR